MKYLRFILTTILICTSLLLNAQGLKISGVVSDASNGDAIPFASITIKGTKTSISADENGNYTITAPGNGTLIFSSIGYKDAEVPVNNQIVVNATLAPDALALDNVVVVAYGVAQKESITGAISSVSSKSIEKRPVSNAVSAIEGMTSGVQINNTYGEPGSTPTIRIRGFTSVTGSNSPLYVIDGVPMSGSTADINPNDIENISILKDAASAALYGNRAANGVVLITTKKGKSEKFRIRANIQQGLYTRGIKEYDKLGPDEWMETQWLALRNSLLSDPQQASKYPTIEAANQQASEEIWSNITYNIYNKPQSEVFDANGKLTPGTYVKPEIAGDLDWYKPIERVGYRQDYNVSGDGASGKMSYYFSVNYLNEKGYIKSSDMQRFTGRANITVEPKKWIKMGLNLNGSYRESNFSKGSPSDNGTSYANPFYFARNIAPIYPVYAHDLDSVNGDYMLDGTGNRIYDWGQYYTRNQSPGRNAIAESFWDIDRYYKTSLTGQGFIDITFLKDFKFSVKADLYNSNSEERTYNNSSVGDGAGAHGRAGRDIYRYKNYTFQQQLTWAKEFNEKHSVDILLGHENYSERYNYLHGYKTGETFADKYDLVNFSEISKLTDYENNYRTEGYIARARYNYDKRYFIEGSYRRDGSSRFYKDNRWGNFWSLGGSWVISREKWMSGVKKQINELKFRASYGEVGNDQSVGRYAYMGLYGLTFNGTKPAAYKTQNEARDITWESSNSLGIALEGRFFNRFNLSVEYFDKRSEDLLFNVYLPLSTGSTDTGATTATVTQNLGNMSNRGVEINFDIDIINKKNWFWSAGFNATFIKNKITKLPEQNREKGIISGTKKYMEGHGIYDYWMYQFVGIDQMTGKSLYLIDEEDYYGATPVEGKTAVPAEHLVTINGKEYTTYTSYARKDWSGTAMPTVYGSFNTSVTWKNLSLSALFTYSLGGKTFDNPYNSLMSVSNNPGAIHRDVLKSWQGVPAGMTETSPDRINPDGLPAIDGYLNTYTNSTSNRWLQNSSYLVFKNLSLSYNLPSRICNKMDINNLSFTFSAENLATITSLRGMDPQQSFSGVTSNGFTTARIFSLGITIVL